MGGLNNLKNVRLQDHTGVYNTVNLNKSVFCLKNKIIFIIKSSSKQSSNEYNHFVF